MPTDRDILKLQQVGSLQTSGAVSPRSAVSEAHESTFVFSNAAGSPLAEVGITMPKACRVKSIRALSGATLATAAANYVTGTVAKRDALGANLTTIGSFTTNSTGGAALTAFVPTTAALVAGTIDIAAGAVLTFALVDNATTTEPAINVSVTVEWI